MEYSHFQTKFNIKSWYPRQLCSYKFCENEQQEPENSKSVFLARREQLELSGSGWLRNQHVHTSITTAHGSPEHHNTQYLSGVTGPPIHTGG